MSNIHYPPDDAGRLGTVLNVIAGIWLILSPWILGFYGLPVAMWATLLAGIAVLVLAIIRLGTNRSVAPSWINLIVGIWLLISPFVLAFNAASRATPNAVILGILVGLFSLWAAVAGQTSVARRP